MAKERYVIGKDFNTNDWFIYDNIKGYNICRCNTEEEAQEFVERNLKGDTIESRVYYFEVHDERDLLACWDIKETSLDKAVSMYIEVLKDPSIIEDEYDLKFYNSLRQKLTDKNYEYVPEESTVYVLYTREEIEQL